MSEVTETAFGGILTAARLGEEWAVAALWRDVHPRLLRYLRVAAGAEAAEDLASEIWLDVAGGLRRFDGDRTSFLRFVFTICRRRVIDAGRRAGRRRTELMPPDALAAAGPAAVDDADAGLALDAALARLAALPRDQAEVILLRVVVGLDADTVGDVLGKRPGTVRVLQHRGLERLAKAVGEERRVTNDVPRTILETDEPLSA
ncbi:MAG TPA: sigma-70 family RNA polymerase sigma factor [Gaiellales bacterium]|nr:sigma-70 family RNA polymerase sigma factor [Gaiellales bacterium]